MKFFLALFIAQFIQATPSPAQAIRQTDPLFAPEFPVVQHPPIGDQGAVGFCWAYALTEFIESEQLFYEQRKVKLSEEYLGLMYVFGRMKEKLPEMKEESVDRKEWDAQVAQAKAEHERRAAEHNQVGEWLGDFTYKTEKELKEIKFRFMYELFVLPSEGVGDFDQALSDIKVNGLVPQSIYPVKFSANLESFNQQLLDWSWDHLHFTDSISAYQTGKKNLLADLQSGMKLPKVDAKTEFEFENRPVTSLGMLSRLNFHPDDFKNQVFDLAHHDEGLQKLRARLKSGHAVPFAFEIYNEVFKQAKKTGRFDLSNCSPSSALEKSLFSVEKQAQHECGSLAGGHAVLAIGILKDKNENEWLLVQNSWGNVGLDQNGEKNKKIDQLGYFLIDFRYLKFLVDHEQKWHALLPR